MTWWLLLWLMTVSLFLRGLVNFFVKVLLMTVLSMSYICKVFQKGYVVFPLTFDVISENVIITAGLMFETVLLKTAADA